MLSANCMFHFLLIIISGDFTVVKTFLFVLEEIQETICPFAYGADVQANVICGKKIRRVFRQLHKLIVYLRLLVRCSM